VAKCEPGTREELLNRIRKWVQVDSGCHQSICWLHGPAGSGKSAVSQTVAELCESSGNLAASFFFPGSGGPNNIGPVIHTLAYQLSLSIPATKTLIQQVLHRDESIVKLAFGYQFDKLLIEPILEAGVDNQESVTPGIIVIDDLHACDSESMVQFIKIITDAKRQLPFRFFLTSRAEGLLQRKLEALAARSIVYALDIRDFHAGRDIRKFFWSRFSNIYDENHKLMLEISRPWPSDSDVEALVQKAEGSFHLAVKIVRDVEIGCDAPHQNLTAILNPNTGPGPDQTFPPPSPHPSASESSHVDSPTSSTSLIQLVFPTATLRGNGGGSRIFGGARAEPLWTTLASLIEQLLELRA
jgi:hypothetical protein